MTNILVSVASLIIIAMAVAVVVGIIKYKPKIDSTLTQLDQTYNNIRQNNQSLSCMTCKLCNSNNYAIKTIVDDLGICGNSTSDCINTAKC